MFNHTGENGFHCAICELVFNRKSRLEKHVKQMHTKTGNDEMQCDICKKSFTGQDELRRHKASHSAAFSKFELNNASALTLMNSIKHFRTQMRSL